MMFLRETGERRREAEAERARGEGEEGVEERVRAAGAESVNL